MAMVVKNNMSAVSTLNTLNKNSNALQKSLSKVSSGMKINSAQDDASGYAISERMRVQIRSLDQANQNTQNGSSMMKTAEGAVSSTVEILKSLKEKAINAANDTNKDADRVTIQKEIDQFIDQIDDNALTTFNGKYLVDGSKAQQGTETFTAMTNQSLSTATKGATALTELKNRNDESLEIRSTDYVTASFVKNGETYTTKFNVGDKTTLQDVFSNLNSHYQTENAGTSKATETIFGPANTSLTKAMTADEGLAILNNSAVDSAAIFKAAGGKNDSDKLTGVTKSDGSDATIGDIKAALAAVIKEKKTSSITNANIKTDFDQAKQDLVNQLTTPITDLSTKVQIVVNNNGTTPVAKDAVITNSITDADSNSYGVTLKASSNIGASAASTDKFALDDSVADIVDGIVDEIDTVVDAAITNGAYTADSASAVANKMTDFTFPANNSNKVDGTASTDVVAAWAGVTKPTAVAATGSKAEDYALAKAYQALVPSDKPEVLSDKKIGKNAAGDMTYTADGTSGLTVTSAVSGIEGQVSGLTISITDSEGNVKKAANASLDAFSTTIYAKNKSDANELSFQVGASANQAIAVGLEDMRSEALGLKGSDGSKVSVATQDKANAAVNVFDNAIQKALDQQTTIGAIEARLEYTSQNLTTSSENVQAAESTIRDADMAKEMTNYTKNNVLLQAAQSMLAQANQSSSAVLSLLQ